MDSWNWRGKQKRAIIQGIYKPLTSFQIYKIVKQDNHRITPQDVLSWLNKFISKKMVYCINPVAVTGRLYFLTEYGRNTVHEEFGIKLSPVPDYFDWNCYSKIVRGRRRRAVLTEIHDMQMRGFEERIAIRIKQSLRGKHPICLNSMIEVLKDLTKSKLIRQTGVTKKRELKVYSITQEGLNIIKEFQRKPVSIGMESERFKR